jgi:hypothetical protein
VWVVFAAEQAFLFCTRDFLLTDLDSPEHSERGERE